MFYEYTLLVPANTQADEPVVVDALVEPGVLTYGEVEFPPGCRHMVHVVIVEGKFQIAPRNPESYMASNDYVVPIYPNYPLKRGHNQLKLKGWSPGTRYQHQIKIRLTVLPKEEAEPLTPLKAFVEELEKLIGI